MNPVRDDTATTCPACQTPFQRVGRQQFCSTACRQAAWRARRTAPQQPVVTKPDTIYACPHCDNRYLGKQRCDDCNTWCHRVGPGSLCPNCDHPVAITDLFRPDQLAPTHT